MAGVESMSVETKEQIQEELGRSRRLLEHAPDKTTKQRLGAYIEELEARLRIASGPPSE
jgi:hypothetical protein